MVETAGVIWLQAGADVNARVDLASATHEQINNARGSNGTFINGVEKPDGAESQLSMPYRQLKAPDGRIVPCHRGPGELAYIAIDAAAAGATVSANYVIELHEEIVNIQTGAKRTPTYQIGNVLTDTTQGGIAANATRVPGQKVPVLALRPLGPNEYGRFYGYVQVVTA